MKGFLEPSVWGKRKAPLPLIPHCDACGLYKHCETPKMPVSGAGRRKILILAEAPGANEDREGVQLIGNAGTKLSEMLYSLGVDMRRDCWLTNAVICRPSFKDGKNRTPDKKEVDACRPNLVKTLRELSPDVVIPIGKVGIESIIPLAWRPGEVKEVKRWAGWRIPSIKLNTWICPTYHPSYLLREEEIRNNVPTMFTKWHLQRALALKGKPHKEIPNYRKQCQLILDHEAASKAVHELMSRKLPLAFDYETNMLKPDSPDSEILCCSVSDGERSIAFPWYGDAITAVKSLLRSDVPKISANLRFEERWTRRHLKIRVNNWFWDTLPGAHWLDCRPEICSLKFQSFVLLGVEDYDYVIDAYRSSKNNESNSRNRLKEVEIKELLMYCALDSLFEVLVAKKQRKLGGFHDV